MLRVLTLAVALAVAPAATRPAWTPGELDILRDMRLDGSSAPPADPTNRHADDPAAARLGAALFNDPRFSADGTVSCATCHRPDYGFTDDLPLGRGIGVASRRTMPIAPAVFSPWQFWDGRADSLWAQALGPVESPVEHGSTRVQVARAFVETYSDAYRAIFGDVPDLSDRLRYPDRATPVGNGAAQRAWHAMAALDRNQVDAVFANFGKAIAAFERTLRLHETRFDVYVQAALAGRPDDRSLSTAEREGLKLFIGKARCIECHGGPLLTNQGFANTGVSAPAGPAPDEGRSVGVQKVLADPFNCRGAFSDARDRCDELEFALTDSPELVRAYKVPSLRGVAARPPYMHAGQLATLSSVIAHYDRAPAAPRGRSQLRPLGLTVAERHQLESFLNAL